jgi:hypothetical protein
VKRHLLTATALAALFLAACSPTTAVLDPNLQQQAAAVLGSLQSLPDTVPHTGVRRVRSMRRVATHINEVEYREEVRVSSSGTFQVECLDVLASNFAQPDEFIAMQNGREGFVHRYRDFRIRDVDLLLANYYVTQLGSRILVAGRSCFTLVLVRRDDPSANDEIVSWSLAVDEQTGLVLRWRRDLDGKLTDEGIYESIAYGDPASFSPHVPTNDETPITPQSDVRRIFGFDLTTPTLLPTFYERRERAAVTDPNGDVWLKETFTDGVEVAFFLYKHDPAAPAAPATAPVLPAPAGKQPSTTGGGHQPSGTSSGVGGIVTLGSASSSGKAMQAILVDPKLVFVTSGEFVIAEYTKPTCVGIVAGRIANDDAQWMLESAFP